MDQSLTNKVGGNAGGVSVARVKDRFTGEKAGETIYETQTRQSGLITEAVFCELKGQRDSINLIDLCYNFSSFEKYTAYEMCAKLTHVTQNENIIDRKKMDLHFVAVLCTITHSGPDAASKTSALHSCQIVESERIIHFCFFE